MLWNVAMHLACILLAYQSYLYGCYCHKGCSGLATYSIYKVPITMVSEHLGNLIRLVQLLVWK